MLKTNILSTPPQIQAIKDIQLPEVETYTTQGSIPVYEIKKPNSGIVMLEVLFYAGRPQEEKQLTSACCAPMMREGAGKYSSEQLSEEIDFRGASITITASMDLITARLVCLKKHLKEMIDILGEILSDPHFDQAELKHFINRRIERLQVEMAKNDIVSYRELTSGIYGEENPYGYNSSEEKYLSIEVLDLKNFYCHTIRQNNCMFFVSGDINSSDRDILEYLGDKIPKGGIRLNKINLVDHRRKPKRSVIKGHTMQTSIKIGRKAIIRKHPDFHKLNFLNTLFGGFFGSRLVTNVREGLGMTYGIYSMIDSQLHDAGLVISTEVANPNVFPCLTEIYKEMDRLKTEKVAPEELSLVANYMMGSYLNLFDGPFNSMKAIKSLVLSDIPLSDLRAVIMASVSVNADDVIEMAQKYFNSEDYWEVIVGTPQI